MTIQYINTGTGANAGDGDSIRSAFIKVNNNFRELVGGITGVELIQSATAPVPANTSTVWYDTVGGRSYIYYDSDWVDMNPNSNSGVHVGPLPPSNPVVGDLWYRTVDAKLYIYNTMNAWVEANPGGTGGGDVYTSGTNVIIGGNSIQNRTTVGINPPNNPLLGDMWYDINSGRLFVYYDSSWIDSSPTYVPSYIDSRYHHGDASGDITFDRNLGTVHTCQLVGNINITEITNMLAGHSFTIILYQDIIGGRTFTAPESFKFALGYKTLSVSANAIDMMNIYYDGVFHYVTLTTGYA